MQQKLWALLLAAGSGKRLSSVLASPKQFLLYQGEPLYLHALDTFARYARTCGIVVVLPQEYLAREEERIKAWQKKKNVGVPILLTHGGEERQDSVRLGLMRLPKDCTHVLIHDCARPFVRPALLERVTRALFEGALAVIPALSLTDTIKRVANGKVKETLPREQLVQVQTPQGFAYETILRAHQRLVGQEKKVTDDAMILEEEGVAVHVVEGEASNWKVTTPADLERMMPKVPSIRVGLGYDVHRYNGDRPFILGGVALATDLKISAHSDGDCLLHALMDALLGQAGLGDIGKLFPDTEQKYAGISSAILLDCVLTLIREKGLNPIHVDATIVAQKPKIAPYTDQIRGNLARLLSLPKSAISVKATTEEHLGFTGRMEGIKVQCLVTSEFFAPSQPMDTLL